MPLDVVDWRPTGRQQRSSSTDSAHNYTPHGARSPGIAGLDRRYQLQILCQILPATSSLQVQYACLVTVRNGDPAPRASTRCCRTSGVNILSRVVTSSASCPDVGISCALAIEKLRISLVRRSQATTVFGASALAANLFTAKLGDIWNFNNGDPPAPKEGIYGVRAGAD